MTFGRIRKRRSPRFPFSFSNGRTNFYKLSIVIYIIKVKMSEWNSKATGNVFNKVPGESGRLVFRQKKCRPLLVIRKNTGLSRFLFLNPRNCKHALKNRKK